MPVYQSSLGPRPAATTPLNSLDLLRLFVGLFPSFPAVPVCAFFSTLNTRPVSLLALPTQRRILRYPALANELLLQLKCNFHVSAHHVFGHAGHAGNECADTAASLGMGGLISENNVPNFLPERGFFGQHFFEIPHRLSQIAEVLHSFVDRSQPW